MPFGNDGMAGNSVHDFAYLPDASAAADVSELIARFGVHAASEAGARADRSRGLGNVVHFCRWRQIERMIVLLCATDTGGATLH